MRSYQLSRRETDYRFTSTESKVKSSIKMLTTVVNISCAHTIVVPIRFACWSLSWLSLFCWLCWSRKPRSDGFKHEILLLLEPILPRFFPFAKHSNSIGTKSTYRYLFVFLMMLPGYWSFQFLSRMSTFAIPSNHTLLDTATFQSL